jgi:hypothetical protein
MRWLRWGSRWFSRCSGVAEFLGRLGWSGWLRLRGMGFIGLLCDIGDFRRRNRLSHKDVAASSGVGQHYLDCLEVNITIWTVPVL